MYKLKYYFEGPKNVNVISYSLILILLLILIIKTISMFDFFNFHLKK